MDAAGLGREKMLGQVGSRDLKWQSGVWSGGNWAGTQDVLLVSSWSVGVDRSE